MEIEANDKFSITQQKIDDNQINNIFHKQIYHDFFNQDSNKDKIEILPKEINSSLEQISQSKSDLNKLEEKMKEFNNKISNLKNDKIKYDDIKMKAKETKDELYNLYFIMINEVNSMKILLKMKNYNKEIYSIHEQALEKHKINYVNTVDRIKLNLKELKDVENEIIENKKNLNKFLGEIINTFKSIIGNINVHLLNYENMELIELKNEEKIKNEISIDVNSIIKEFLDKKDELINQIGVNYNSQENKEKESKTEYEIINQKIEMKENIKEEDIKEEDMKEKNEEIKGYDNKMEEENNKIYYEDLNKIFEHLANDRNEEIIKNNGNKDEQKATFGI